MTMSTKFRLARVSAAAATMFIVGLLAVGAAQAQRHDGRDYRGGGGGGPGHDHYDNRYDHNHYYPSRGYEVGYLPRGRYAVYDRYRHPFFYSGGVFYAPRGPRFVVVGPPIGVFVPVLPGFYSTVYVGGFPYYYANDTYYVWRSRERAYEVVDAPSESSVSTSTPAVASDIFVYPKNGQNEEQTAKDKYECHRWAASETGFDPTQSGGGVPAEQNAAKRGDYQRAMGACLDGRGYSVK
jgi:hypothetical protein